MSTRPDDRARELAGRATRGRARRSGTHPRDGGRRSAGLRCRRSGERRTRSPPRRLSLVARAAASAPRIGARRPAALPRIGDESWIGPHRLLRDGERELGAVAVEDRPPFRREHDRADPLRLTERGVPRRVDGLEHPHSHQDRAEREDGDDERACEPARRTAGLPRRRETAGGPALCDDSGRGRRAGTTDRRCRQRPCRAVLIGPGRHGVRAHDRASAGSRCGRRRRSRRRTPCHRGALVRWRSRPRRLDRGWVRCRSPRSGCTMPEAVLRHGDDALGRLELRDLRGAAGRTGPAPGSLDDRAGRGAAGPARGWSGTQPRRRARQGSPCALMNAMPADATARAGRAAIRSRAPRRDTLALGPRASGTTAKPVGSAKSLTRSFSTARSRALSAHAGSRRPRLHSVSTRLASGAAPSAPRRTRTAGRAGTCSPRSRRSGSGPSRCGPRPSGRRARRTGRPGASASIASSIDAPRISSSRFTSMRIAWNVRLAGWPPRAASGRGDGVARRSRRARRSSRSAGRRRSPWRCGRRSARRRSPSSTPASSLLGVAVDDVGRGRGRRRVHPHVEGSVVAVAEATLATVELRRADPEVEERSAE